MANRNRRNLSGERQVEILDAFKRCILEHGLEKSSMRLVAGEAGVSQPLLSHHFGSRDGLVEAFVRHMVDEYDEALALALEKLNEEGGAQALLDYLFGGPYSKSSEPVDGLFSEFVNAATRDTAIRTQLANAYARYQRILTNHLRKTYPKASASECRRIAYGLMCLAESNEHLRAMELPGRRSRDALESARVLMDSLPS